MPNASPDSCTFWGLAAASSVISNTPLSFFAFELAAAGGLNITETWQSAPAAKVAGQLSWAINPAPAVTSMMLSATGFLLVNVTDCGALRVPRCVLPNESVCGCNCNTARTPEPLRPTGLAL